MLHPQPPTQVLIKPEQQHAGRAIRDACLETVAAGTRTADLGGHAGTSEFTDAVIARTRAKLSTLKKDSPSR